MTHLQIKLWKKLNLLKTYADKIKITILSNPKNLGYGGNQKIDIIMQLKIILIMLRYFTRWSICSRTIK